MEKKDSSINLKLLHEKLDPVNEVALIRLKSTLHSVISKAFLTRPKPLGGPRSSHR